MAQPSASRLEPRRFIAAEITDWDQRLKTASRWAAGWSIIKLLAGLATGGWALVADGIVSGSDLLGIWLTTLIGKPASGKTGRLLIRGVVAMLMLTAGVIVVRMGLGRLFSPGTMLPVLYLTVSALIMSGQFIAARFVSSRQQMTARHEPVYRILAGSVLSSVFITLTAAACNVPAWMQADAIITLGIGFIAALKSAGLFRQLIAELLDAPEQEPGMLEVAAVLCSHHLVLETHSLRIRRGKDGKPVLRASIVLDRDQFPLALHIKRELEARVRADFGIDHINLRYELKPGEKAFWNQRAVFDQCMLN
jgi:divalent metal cation (Fe/Co/Zn/Cd) transporter